MAEGSDPTVQRLALRLRLREIRIKASLTQKQVAQRLVWSPSKVLRIESGEVGLSVTDLQALLDLYKVKDPRLVEELSRLAMEGRKQIAGAFDDVLSREIQLLLRYEKSASIIRQFEPVIMPGLLQTREYAEAMLRLYAGPDDTERMIQRRVEARLERQELLERGDPPEMFFILDEAVVRRWISSSPERPATATLMRQQLEHLKKVGEHPRISIQVMPFTAGGYKQMRRPFVVLEFPDPSLSELVYLEDIKDEYISREDPVDTRPYLEQFWEMEERALPREELNTFLDSVLQGMGESGNPAGG